LAVSGWHGSLLGITTSPSPYRGFRFPPEIIKHAIWLYHCFSLSLSDVELMPAERRPDGAQGRRDDQGRDG
jgi:hypothetical protein